MQVDKQLAVGQTGASMQPFIYLTVRSVGTKMDLEYLKKI
jgi:hypothetical protein